MSNNKVFGIIKAAQKKKELRKNSDEYKKFQETCSLVRYHFRAVERGLLCRWFNVLHEVCPHCKRLKTRRKKIDRQVKCNYCNKFWDWADRYYGQMRVYREPKQNPQEPEYVFVQEKRSVGIFIGTPNQETAMKAAWYLENNIFSEVLFCTIRSDTLNIDEFVPADYELDFDKSLIFTEKEMIKAWDEGREERKKREEE
jgi:hypothetical protein